MYVLSYLVCFAKKKPLGTSISVFIFIYQLWYLVIFSCRYSEPGCRNFLLVSLLHSVSFLMTSSRSKSRSHSRSRSRSRSPQRRDRLRSERAPRHSRSRSRSRSPYRRRERRGYKYASKLSLFYDLLSVDLMLTLDLLFAYMLHEWFEVMPISALSWAIMPRPFYTKVRLCTCPSLLHCLN
jgi:hypothetical protein